MLSNNTYWYMDEASIHPLLKCKLCSKPFVDPVSTQNGDRFCRSCISKILRQEVPDENSKVNPSSHNQAFKMQSLTPVTEKLVVDMLDSIPVRCLDCEETNIPRGKLDEHKNKSCIQATVLCTAADIKCPWIGTREELDRHLSQCYYEPLRPAFEGMFNEITEMKNKFENLKNQLNESTNQND